ncbi:phage tail assembly chaperone [Erythrobacter sp. HL-111]|uniref:phage tail assembly chaperone n=1 Tax=Erythrobacter sp. HL-111 TaxID=1798193 RepID=UPI0006D9C893|nr:phage tail assembly chaperone [Erythrobacter sp. HL-111]KPP94111.1 MAG: Conserved hypothetical phage protein (DUF2376) [Erythrobacteraceae bacterium HL-111]SDS63076.1 Phage tail assembly chaperone protein, TAC [Erythrobacter sp. HL-111]
MNRTFGEMAARASALAAQALGWSPAQFWTSTPRELALALQPLSGHAGAEAPSREEIDRMMERDRHG